MRRGVITVTKNEDSRTVRAGSITYFFDVKKTRENKPFLVITESRFKGEGKDHERKTIVVFQENIKEFAEVLNEIAVKLN